MPKRKTKADYYEDDEYSEIHGIGSYVFNSGSPGKTKLKHQIGFIRPKVKTVVRMMARTKRRTL